MHSCNAWMMFKRESVSTHVSNKAVSPMFVVVRTTCTCGIDCYYTHVPAAHWWLSGNVKLGLNWGSVVHCDVFVLVCCAFCMLGNVHLMFLEVLDTHLVKVKGGGLLFLATAQLTERPTEPSLSRH